MINQISRIEFLIERKKFSEAQSTLSEAMTSYPDAAVFHNLLAQIHYHKDDANAALKCINNAIGIEPDNDFYHFWKALILFESNDYKNAMQSIEEALEIDPEDAEYYGLKSMILLSQEKKEASVECARNGLSKDPENIMCRNALSMALSSSGKVDESKIVLTKLLEKDPENAWTQSNLGYNYLRKGDIKKAEEHFRASLLLDPENAYTKAGMMEAVKASNFLYRKVLAYGVWMEKLNSANRWVFIIGLIVVVKILPFLLPFYLIFILWVWFAPPIAEVILYFDKNGRYLMTGETRLFTQVNIGLLGLSVICLIMALTTNTAFFGLAFASFASIVPIYLIETRIKKSNKLGVAAFALLFMALGISGLVLSLSGTQATGVWMGLMGSIILFTWVVGFIND